MNPKLKITFTSRVAFQDFLRDLKLAAQRSTRTGATHSAFLTTPVGTPVDPSKIQLEFEFRL